MDPVTAAFSQQLLWYFSPRGRLSGGRNMCLGTSLLSGQGVSVGPRLRGLRRGATAELPTDGNAKRTGLEVHGSDSDASRFDSTFVNTLPPGGFYAG